MGLRLIGGLGDRSWESEKPKWETGVKRVRDRNERVKEWEAGVTDRSERVSLREMFRDEMRVNERERERGRCVLF